MTELFSAFELTLFNQLAVILLLAGVLGFIGLKLRQPLIVVFIATGILAGPSLLSIIPDHSVPLETLAELGIALLLFMVGLKLDVKLIRTLGSVALATAIGQMTFTGVISFFICMSFGFGLVPSLYVAASLTFSSTIIIVKLLSDKREIDSLHGKIALGFLIVEDLFVVLYMILLSTFATGEDNGPLLTELGFVLLKMGFLLSLIAIFITTLATPLTNRLAHSQELMVTCAAGWATAMAVLADLLGFSIELGGLLAGIALASTPLRDLLAARLSALRDFMLLFFFIVLGSKMDLGQFAAQIVPALVLSVFVLLGKPLSIMTIMGLMGYRQRTSFKAGLTVAQISEFSLILVALGVSLGHVGEDLLGLVTLVGLITISLSAYMITWSENILKVAEPFLGVFERNTPYREASSETEEEKTYDILLFGLGRYGAQIARELLARDVSVLGLDFDPAAVRRARADLDSPNFAVTYGDVTDADFATHLPLEYAKWIICAVPQHPDMLQSQDFRFTLIEAMKTHGFKGKIAVVSHGPEETARLQARKVDVVLTPFSDAAREGVKAIMSANSI